MSMKKLNIIKSNTEPDKNNLWLKDGEIKEFNGGWKSISSGKTIPGLKPEGGVVIPTVDKTGMLVFKTLEEALAGDVKDGEIVSVYKPSTKRQIDISEVAMLHTENDGVTYISGDTMSNMSEFYVDYISSFSDTITIRFKNGEEYRTIILNPQNPFKVVYLLSGRDEDFIFDVPGARPWVFPEDVGIDIGLDTYLIGILQGNISIQALDFATGLSLDLINLLNDIKKLGWSVTVGEAQSMALYKKVNSEFKKFTLDSFFPITWDLTTYISSSGSKESTTALFYRCMYEGTTSVVINDIPEEFEYIQGVYIRFSEGGYYCPVIYRDLKLEDVTSYPKSITFLCPAIVDSLDNHSFITPLNGNFYISIIQVSKMDYPILIIGRDINPTKPDIIFYPHGSESHKNLSLLNTLSMDRNYVCGIVGHDINSKYYSIIGTYYNGTITAFEDNKIKHYDVSFDTGEITEIASFDPNMVMLDLELVSPESADDTDATIAARALNLEKLQKTLTLPFLCLMDYGVGTGRYINGSGGEINVTYATGGNGHYTIGTDGSIVKDTNYVPGNTYAYLAYKNNGGTKTEEQFYSSLAALIDT